MPGADGPPYSSAARARTEDFLADTDVLADTDDKILAHAACFLCGEVIVLHVMGNGTRVWFHKGSGYASCERTRGGYAKPRPYADHCKHCARSIAYNREKAEWFHTSNSLVGCYDDAWRYHPGKALVHSVAESHRGNVVEALGAIRRTMRDLQS